MMQVTVQKTDRRNVVMRQVAVAAVVASRRRSPGR